MLIPVQHAHLCRHLGPCRFTWPQDAQNLCRPQFLACTRPPGCPQPLKLLHRHVDHPPRLAPNAPGCLASSPLTPIHSTECRAHPTLPFSNCVTRLLLTSSQLHSLRWCATPLLLSPVPTNITSLTLIWNSVMAIPAFISSTYIQLLRLASLHRYRNSPTSSLAQYTPPIQHSLHISCGLPLPVMPVYRPTPPGPIFPQPQLQDMILHQGRHHPQ